MSRDRREYVGGGTQKCCQLLLNMQVPVFKITGLPVSSLLSLPFHTAVLWMMTAASFTHDSWLPGWSEVGQKGGDCATAAVCFYQSG